MDIYGLLITLTSYIVLISANQNERISITPSDEALIKFVNDSIFVLCNPPTGKTVYWRSPKGEIVKNTKGRVHVETKEQGESLVFEHISLSDKGNWSCAVEDGVGTAGFKLVVNQRIRFVDTNTLQTVREGNEVNIRCEVKGDPEPSVTWSFNGKNLDLTDSMPDKGKYSKLADGLLIKRVTQNDTGEYTCRAYQISETISETQDHTILLKIEHKPIWINHKDENDVRYAYNMGEVNITCEAVGEPPANFTWSRSPKKLDKKHYKIHNNEPHKSTLNFIVKDSTYFGEYKCTAKNPSGDIERMIKLLEGIKPSPPSVFQLRGLNSNTFDVDVGSVRTTKIRNLMDVNGYRIEYITEYDFKLNGANWSYAKRRDFPFEDGVTFLINNLESNTTYLMRAAAKNLAGLSSWTKVEKFTTQSNEPPTNSALKMIPINLNIFTQTIFIISIITVILSQLNSINFLQSYDINMIRFYPFNKNKNSFKNMLQQQQEQQREPQQQQQQQQQQNPLRNIFKFEIIEAKLNDVRQFIFQIIENAFMGIIAIVLYPFKLMKISKQPTISSSSLSLSFLSLSSILSSELALNNNFENKSNVNRTDSKLKSMNIDTESTLKIQFLNTL